MDNVKERMEKADQRVISLVRSALKTGLVFSEEDTFTALTGVLAMDSSQEEMFEIAASAILTLAELMHVTARE